MQRFLLLIGYLLFLTLSLFAQPVIQEQILLELNEGEPIEFLALNAGNFNPGPAGERQNWDFAQISKSNKGCFFEALDPTLSQFRDSFPNATVYFICRDTSPAGQIVENHTFYRYLESSALFEGTVSLSISDPDFDSIFTVFTDPQTFLTFPYEYLGTFTDEYSARVTTYTQNQQFTVQSSGSLTSRVDAFGTLTTPVGTFEDVLRISRSEISNNEVAGIPLGSSNEAFRYTWIAKGENYPKYGSSLF